MPDQSLNQEDVAAVQSKLQGLYESLSAQQRSVLDTLLAHAADGGAAFQERGTAAQHSIIIVGGHTGPELAIPLSPEVLASLNPQPIPPGEPSDDRAADGPAHLG